MRVLLVDDEEDTLRAMTHLLDHCDVEIVPTPDSGEAAKHIINQNFDAMIIDVHVSSPDGLELTRLARKISINRSTPIALIAGDDEIEIRFKGLEAGASCFAEKPLNPKKLWGILRILQAVSSGDRNWG